MNIWLPIITNIILVAVVFAVMFVSRKEGWRLALSKLICTVLCGVGAWFLSPIIANELVKIEFIGQLAISNLNIVVFSLLTLICFLIIAIICSIIHRATKYAVKEALNGAKVRRAKSIDRKVERQLRREERKARKLNRHLKLVSKKSRVLATIFGFITGLIVCVLVFIPMKASFSKIAEITGNIQYESAYEYTAVGQIEKLIIKED